MTDAEKRAAFWFRCLGMAGLILSAVTFILYGMRMLPSRIPPSRSAAYWGESAEAYGEKMGGTDGFRWSIRDGEQLCTAALALLASTSLPTLIVLAVMWLRRREGFHGAMALIISMVLIAAILGFR